MNLARLFLLLLIVLLFGAFYLAGLDMIASLLFAIAVAIIVMLICSEIAEGVSKIVFALTGKTPDELQKPLA